MRLKRRQYFTNLCSEIFEVALFCKRVYHHYGALNFKTVNRISYSKTTYSMDKNMYNWRVHKFTSYQTNNAIMAN